MQLLLLAQSPVLRIGLRGVLEQALPIASVVEANNALEAITIPAGSTDRMLTIIQDSLPGVTGVVAARVCRDRHPDSVILVLSERASVERSKTAIDFGANALLPAEIQPAQLVETINEHFSRPADTRPSRSQSSRTGSVLRGDEIAVLDGLVRGLSFHQMADVSLLGDQSVRASSDTLLRKLNAADRTTAVVAAIRNGLVDLSVQLPIQLQPAPDLSLTSSSFK
jgi:DNA-binding NarL/FixJ family response regulator